MLLEKSTVGIIKEKKEICHKTPTKNSTKVIFNSINFCIPTANDHSPIHHIPAAANYSVLIVAENLSSYGLILQRIFYFANLSISMFFFLLLFFFLLNVLSH